MFNSKGEDGKYHIKGKVFELLIGTRAQVWHGTAYKTSGGLLKEDLFQNKNGRIVSRRKHVTAKREKRLEKHGFFAQKGKFGMVQRHARTKHKRARKHSTRRRRK